MSEDEPPGGFKAELERVIDARNSFLGALWGERWPLSIALGLVWLGCFAAFVVWMIWR